MRFGPIEIPSNFFLEGYKDSLTHFAVLDKFDLNVQQTGAYPIGAPHGAPKARSLNKS
jgi:hypothetical protein